MSGADRGHDTRKPTPYVFEVADEESISCTVVDAVASVSGRTVSPFHGGSTGEDDGTEPLDPLHEVIDPDALEALCRPRDDDPREATTVTFAYCGCEVTVESTGRVTVTGN